MRGDSMAGKKEDIRSKQRRIIEQGFSAARQNKIQPRELSNVQGDRWEDAKVYSTQTRQGQNYRRERMKENSRNRRGK